MLLKVANSAILRQFVRSSSSGGHHATEESVRRWTILSGLTIIPLAACWLNAYQLEKKEEEHFKHHRPEYIPYAHLNIRTKKFPWGDGNHTPFHNKERNPLPGGYED